MQNLSPFISGLSFVVSLIALSVSIKRPFWIISCERSFDSPGQYVLTIKNIGEGLARDALVYFEVRTRMGDLFRRNLEVKPGESLEIMFGEPTEKISDQGQLDFTVENIDPGTAVRVTINWRETPLLHIVHERFWELQLHPDRWSWTLIAKGRPRRRDSPKRGWGRSKRSSIN